MKRMRTLAVVFSMLLPASVVCQQRQAEQQFELIGTLSFNVASESARVEKLAVQIGDGGTGKYKAILAGEPSLPPTPFTALAILSPLEASFRCRLSRSVMEVAVRAPANSGTYSRTLPRTAT